MHRLLMVLILLGSLLASSAADVATGSVLKVLPLFLDRQGHDAVSPSLYDRDAYQVQLREHPEQRSAIRFDVLWKAADAGGAKLKLRVELRGIGAGGLPQQTVLEQEVQPKFFRSWNSIILGGEDYKKFGEVAAWRATLWAGDRLLGEQKSFLW